MPCSNHGSRRHGITSLSSNCPSEQTFCLVVAICRAQSEAFRSPRCSMSGLTDFTEKCSYICVAVYAGLTMRLVHAVSFQVDQTNVRNVFSSLIVMRGTSFPIRGMSVLRMSDALSGYYLWAQIGSTWFRRAVFPRATWF